MAIGGERVIVSRMARAQAATSGTGTQAIQRAVHILKEIGDAGSRGLRIVDLCDRLPVERPTLHRIISCLVTEGLIERDERSKRYLLGQSAYRLGVLAATRFDLKEICSAALTRISAATGDTVFLAVRRGADGVVVDKRDGPRPISSNPLEIGMPRPLGVGASGLAILSALPDGEIERIIQDNARRLRDHNVKPDKLQSLVARSRRNGYAFSRGYGPPRICGVGLPLKNARGRCIGAVSVTALTERMNADHRREIIAAMQEELAPVHARLRIIQD
jgi:DNA-binding IclR family transcriptional regulator